MNLKRSREQASIYREKLFLQTIQQDGVYDSYIKANHLELDLNNYIKRRVEAEPFIEVGYCETDHGIYKVDIEQYQTIVLTNNALNIQKLPMEEPLSAVERLYLYCSKYKKTEEDPTTAFEVIVESRNLKKQYREQAIHYQMDLIMDLDETDPAKWQKQTAIADLLNPEPNRQDAWKKNFEEDFLKEYFHQVLEPVHQVTTRENTTDPVEEMTHAFTKAKTKTKK